MSFLTTWLEHYGYWVLFIALMLEMLALPLPGEVLMSYAGLLVFEGKMNWLLAIAAAGGGVAAGVTLSYWIGFRLGRPFFEKHGRRFHLGPDKLDHASRWFGRYGNKLLLIAFFIPGIRHFTGYFSGVTRIAYRKYAAFSYTGAFLWVGVFITLGKLLGPKWEQYHHTVSRILIWAGIGAAVIALLVYLVRRNRVRLMRFPADAYAWSMARFHSLGTVKFLVLAAFVLFTVFFSLMLGLIQDFLAQEFTQFDEIASFLVLETFGPGWERAMALAGCAISYAAFIPFIAATAIWIMIRGKERLLELLALVWVIAGGEAFDDGLRLLFHRSGPDIGAMHFVNTFPSQDTLTVLTVYGFGAFLLLRHTGSLRLRLAAAAAVIALCLFVGVSRVYFSVQYPSDAAAGYVFGGVWVSLNMLLLEAMRKLQTAGPVSGAA